MEDFYWETEHYHPSNTFTMIEYLEQYLPKNYDCFFQDGSYAEIVENTTGVIYGLHASGNGDSFNHKISFEFVH